MSKKNYFTLNNLEQEVYGAPLKAPDDMVRPTFVPLDISKYDVATVFYEDNKMLVLEAPVCDSHMLLEALTHEPCEAEIYLSRLLALSGDDKVIISLDTEYQENPQVFDVKVDESDENGPIYEDIKSDDIRGILSCQISAYYRNQVLRLIFFSKTSEILSLSNILRVIFNAFGVKASRYSVKKKQAPIEVCILAYNALADVSTLRDFPDMANSLVKSADLLSRESYKLRVSKNNAYYYDSLISVVGVQNHVPGGLAKLGKSMQLDKIKLDDDVITRMQKYRTENFEEFLKYGINDSDICLLWYLLNYKDMYIPISSPALGAKIIEDAIADGATGDELKKKVLEWRGLIVNKVLSTDRWYNRPSYLRVSEDPISNIASNIFLEASDCYAGGMNQCMMPGFYARHTYDYDLCGCYPTAGSMLRDPDYQIEETLDLIYKREITMDDVLKYDVQTYGFGDVRFEFPSNTTFPCIAQGDGNRGLIFTVKSEKYVYATWPEVRTAILMGATVYAHQFHFYESKKDENGDYIYTLRKAFKKMSIFRELAQQRYGSVDNPKPIQAQIWKLAASGAYGKLAQNVKAKKTRDVRYDQTVEMGPSSITSPAHASYITAIPRVLLCAVMEQLTQKGFNCYSVTTDGFITDAPIEALEACDGYGLVDLYRESRMYLVGTPKVWETKHEQNFLLNITTRANQGFDDLNTCLVGENNVNAHVGYKRKKLSEEEKKLTEQIPNESMFIHDYLTGGKEGIYLEIEKLPNLNDVVRRKMDYVKSILTSTLKFNFDYKRKPDELKEVIFPFYGKEYKVLNFKTKPYNTFEEYEKYRNAKDRMNAIRTFEDYINVFKTANSDKTGVSKIPTLDEQVKASIYHLRLTPDKRAVLDASIKYKNLEYIIAVLKGTIRKSLDAYMVKHPDGPWLTHIDTYQADFLTKNNWPNYAKKDRYRDNNYMGYAMWVENAIMYRLRMILEEGKKEVTVQEEQVEQTEITNNSKDS